MGRMGRPTTTEAEQGPPPPINPATGEIDPSYDRKRVRKAVNRKTIVYNSSVLRHIEVRRAEIVALWSETVVQSRVWQRGPRYSQAHDCAVRTITWSHNDLWLISGSQRTHQILADEYEQCSHVARTQRSRQGSKVNIDHVTLVIYFCGAIILFSFCPTDAKFTTCSDDGTVRIWDFFQCQEERVLRGVNYLSFLLFLFYFLLINKGHGSDIPRKVSLHLSFTSRWRKLRRKSTRFALATTQ